jgi:geranylgeranylglycerol-phosphate geranylgeranyltransferase
MKIVYYFIKVTRPSNVFIAFCVVFVAASITGTIQPVEHVLLAAITVAFITAGANIINDYYDIEIDRINKPDRLLASGKITPGAAFIYFIIVYLCGWLVALLIHWTMFLVAFSVGILLYLYSFRLKRTVLWGNATVSFASAMAFIYGGMAVNRLTHSLFPAGFAFLFHFGREIIKDMEDIKGDRKTGSVTFAIKFGFLPSLYLTATIFILLILLTLIPYILGIYSIYYMLVVILGVYPVLLYVLYSSWKNPYPDNLNRLSNLLKVDMIVGLLAIYLG